MASKTSQINFSGQGKLLLPELGRDFHRRTGTFRLGGGGGGGRRPYCPKKITQCPKECVVQTHSNRSKTKTLPILTSNERFIIPKSEFFEPQRETKIGSKNRIFREIKGN